MVHIQTIDNMYEDDGQVLLQAALRSLATQGRTQRLIAVLPVYREEDPLGGALDRVYVVTADEPDRGDRDATVYDALAAHLLLSGDLVHGLMEKARQQALAALGAVQVTHPKPT